MRLTYYLYASLLHLIPIEIIFFYFTKTYPDWGQSILFLNYIYGIVVIFHGVHFWRHRIIRILVESVVKEYINTVKKQKSPAEDIMAGFSLED